MLPIHGPVTVGLSSDLVFQALDQVTQTEIVPPPQPTCPSCPFCGAGSSSGGGSGAGFGGTADAGAVSVISQQTVGPYDTVQLQSSDPRALDNWLSANGYAVPTGVQPVIDAYVSAGFDFLAMKLAPGQGVAAMRPVRVTSSGAGLSLPLRMVAAGTGATVGVVLWVVGDGRYDTQNFTSFTISPSDIVWDWSTNESNYTTLRAQKEAALNDAAWQIESALQISPYQIENTVLYSPNDYLPIPASDGGADSGASAGESADQVRQDDLAVLFPNGSQGDVWVTRMRADLSHAALATDLVLLAAADQSVLSNIYQVTQSVNAPTCPPAPDPCPPCEGSTSGGDTGDASGSSSGGILGASTGQSGGGCSTAPDDDSGSGVPITVGALLGAALVLGRKRDARR